jgi:hypothetical protein
VTAPQWSVVIQIDPDVAGETARVAADAVIALGRELHVALGESGPRLLVGMAGNRADAERVAEAARRQRHVTAAYAKPPDALP